jgi:glyoxylase-like metal-dependent hydrolase (beta-lactamase superfamily II)
VPTSWTSLLDALSRLGRSQSDVEALVLTHAHFDHVGFAERARSELGIPVFAHAGEEPVTRHPLRYKRERSPLLYPFRHPKALPIVAAFARNGVLRTPGITRSPPTPTGTSSGCPARRRWSRPLATPSVTAP